MSVSKLIDQFIAENGGNERDALNVALTRLELMTNILKNSGTNLETVTVESHTETIICPACDKVQKATVSHTDIHNIYIHHCEKCGYVIMESDWNAPTEAEIHNDRKEKLIAALEWHRKKSYQKGYGVAEFDVVIDYLKTSKTDFNPADWRLLNDAINFFDEMCHEYLNDKQQ
jgi:Zn ribbon nucleic-acid-binding protein